MALLLLLLLLLLGNVMLLLVLVLLVLLLGDVTLLLDPLQGPIHGLARCPLDGGLNILSGHGLGDHSRVTRCLADIPCSRVAAGLVCCCWHVVHARESEVPAGPRLHRGSRAGGLLLGKCWVRG